MIAGSAPTFYPSLCVGATGGILAVSCVLPALCVQLHEHFRAGRHAEARDLQRRLTPLAKLVTTGSASRASRRRWTSPGFAGGEPRAPLGPLTAEATAGPRRPAQCSWPSVRPDIRAGDTAMTPERLLLGPGPSPVSARVMRAMAAPVLSHLDPEMMVMLDDLRAPARRDVRRRRRARSASRSPGTGTSGMEAAVANITAPGARVLVVVTGYFGDRLAQILERYGATVTRVDVEWGRACDPAAVERALAAAPARHRRRRACRDVDRCAQSGAARLPRSRREHGALTVVDAVTSLGAMPVETGAWGIDVCYSCSQKGLGAPSGLAPFVVLGARAVEAKCRRAASISILALLEDYWVRRKYHHTISAPLIYALREALVAVEDEGLEARWARHERNHRALAAGLEALGLSLLPPAGERLWTLNAVRVPDGVDEAAVRRRLLDEFSIEIGAGLGPLAGTIWRVGLMGAGSTLANVLLFLTALERVLAAAGYRVAGRRAAAGDDAARGRWRSSRAGSSRRRRRRRNAHAHGRASPSRRSPPPGSRCAAYIYLTLPDVRVLRTQNPPTTAFMELRARQAIDKGEPPRRVQRWVQLRAHLAAT